MLLLPCFARGAVTVSSPSGTLEFQISESGGRLMYEVRLGRRPVIESSPLGIVIDSVNLAEGAALGEAARYRRDETFDWYGVHTPAHDRANGARIQVRHAASRTAYTIDARAYDDGIAFRFVVPGSGKARVPDESTAFRIPSGSTVWFHDFEGHYEGVQARYAIEEVKAGSWAAPPLTFRLPGGGYGSITEAVLRDYAGMGLQGDGKRGFAARLGHSHPDSYPFRLRYKEDVERMKIPASIEGTITTPWRVVLAGADLNTLVNADVIPALAPPPDPKYFPKGIHTDWIKPGRAVWKYLDGGENTLAEMREFSRMAGELGFEYNVIEGFWQKWTPEELKGFVEESRKRGVGVILWKHSRELRTPEKRREFFEMCSRAGVAGAKIDFFDHEAKEIVDLYEACLRDAAEFHQVIDFHGANKPTGLSRTWPNELTREAIRGMESRRVERGPHDATLPFTRMLAGHADYTPMLFTERRGDTSWAHQIATAVIYTSPLLVYGSHPKNILENPAVEVIRAIPSVWDETRVLPFSDIGDVAGFARRREGRWFIAIANGAAERTVEVPLNFLGTGRFDAVLVRDNAATDAAVEMERRSTGTADILAVKLRAGGGFVAMLTPRK